MGKHDLIINLWESMKFLVTFFFNTVVKIVLFLIIHSCIYGSFLFIKVDQNKAL